MGERSGASHRPDPGIISLAGFCILNFCKGSRTFREFAYHVLRCDAIQLVK